MREEKSVNLLEREAAIQSVFAELDGLVGLVSVKKYVRTFVDSISFSIGKYQSQGRDRDVHPGHFVFLGNPGTGKATVARLMGRMFHSLGVLARGHVIEVTGADLVAPYRGQSALPVQDKVREALDGILFIDEAWRLLPEPGTAMFGFEALDELLTLMENDRARLCVIVAGCPSEIQRFLEANPAVPRHYFSNRIVGFPDYSAEELEQIAARTTLGVQ